MENEAFRRCTGSNMIETPNAANIGVLQLSAAPNISGSSLFHNGSSCYGGSSAQSGAFKAGAAISNKTVFYDSGAKKTLYPLEIDASLSNTAYGRDNAQEIRPTNYAVFTFIAY